MKIENENSFINGRFGRFYVSVDFINADPKSVMVIMSHTIIVRAERMYHRDEIEYIALSPLFAVIETGHLIPEYLISITADGIVTATRCSSPLHVPPAGYSLA